MAVTLPVFLLIYEALFYGLSKAPLTKWPFYAGRVTVVTGLLTIPYVIGKLTGPGTLVENPAYQLSISAGRYLDTFHLYLNPLLYQQHVFRDPNTIQMLLAMIAFAVWRQSRPMIFAWLFLLLSLLPVAFVNHYSAFFMYIPSVGWALYAGELLVMVRRALSRGLGLLFRRPGEYRLAAAFILVTAIVLGLAPLHERERAKTFRLFRSVQPPSREMAAELLRSQPAVKAGGRLLFVNDPFPRDEYFLLFLARLVYHDMTLDIVRTAVRSVPADEYRHFDAVFVFENGKLVRIAPTSAT